MSKQNYNLVGQDGNAYALMGYTKKAMKEQKFTAEEIKAVMDKAMSSDYSNLLCVLDTAIIECNARLLKNWIDAYPEGVQNDK
jgi:hypothetical protein